MPWKSNAPMPTCNLAQRQEILDVMETFTGKARDAAAELAWALGPKDLCMVLHAMRRWYTYNSWVYAGKILPHVEHLGTAMDLSPPLGVFRGFKVAANNPLLRGLDEGDVIDLPVERNGGCSSWTADRAVANRFSGGGKGKVGLVIKLVGGEGVQTFIAPPGDSKPWFNRLYSQTMGTSFRDNEVEYAVYAPSVEVEIVAIKR